MFLGGKSAVEKEKKATPGASAWNKQERSAFQTSSCSSASDAPTRERASCLVACFTSCKTGLWSFSPGGPVSLGTKSNLTLKRHSPTRYLIHHLPGKSTSLFLPARSHPSLTPPPLHLHRCKGGSRSGGFRVGREKMEEGR